MDDKLKAIILLVVIGAAGYFGYTYLMEGAKSASNQELYEKYSILPGASTTSPYNQELERRIEAEEIKFTELAAMAKEKDEKKRALAYHLMAYVPKKSRDDVVSLIDREFKDNATYDVRAEMVFALKEVTLNGLPGKDEALKKAGKKSFEMLIHFMTDEKKYGKCSMELEKNVICPALKELARAAGDDRTNAHDKTGWVAWWTTGGGNQKYGFIPEEFSNNRGKNK